MKQWKSGKLILQGKGYACISPDGSNELTWLPLEKIRPKGAPGLQNRDETTKPQEEEIPIWAMVALKISRKHHPRRHQPYDLPTWGQIKILTDKAENLVSQQGMPRSPEYIFLAVLTLLACTSPIRALTNHTYWAYIPNPPLLQVVEWTERGPVVSANDSIHVLFPEALKGPHTLKKKEN